MAEDSTQSEYATVHAVFNLVTSVFVMTFNVVVIVAISQGKQFHHQALRLMTLVASCDFLVGLYVFIFVIPSAFPGKCAHPNSLMHTAFPMRTALISQKVMNMAFVTVDLYVAIQWPLLYQRIATKSIYIRIVSMTFFLNAIFSVASHMSLEGTFYNVSVGIHTKDFITIAGLLPGGVFIAGTLIIIVFCSEKILLTIAQSRHKARTVTLAQKSIGKSSFMVALTSCVIFVSFSPVSILNIVNLTTIKDIVQPIIFQFESFILMSNSLMNVFIYTAKYRPFQKALLFVFCKSHYRRKKQACIVQALKIA